MRVLEPTDLAVATIVAEAGGEGYDGMLAVAEVIRNRMLSRYASDGTVEGTILRPFQFSCWNTAEEGARLRMWRLKREEPVVVEAERAWKASWRGTTRTHGAVLYYNPQLVAHPPGWVARAVPTVTIGKHAFFRER